VFIDNHTEKVRDRLNFWLTHSRHGEQQVDDGL